MKQTMFATTLSAMLIILPGVAGAISFDHAFKSSKLEFQVRNDFGDRRMSLKLKNKSFDPLKIELETGRIFYPEDPGIQPYVNTRPSIIALEPGETKEVWLHARCGNSSAASPEMHSQFLRTGMGSPAMIATLEDMNRLKITDSYFYQQVVWHYTNDHDISTIIGSADVDPAINEAIIRDMCKRDNIKRSEYQKHYQSSPTGDNMEFTGVPEKITKQLNIVLEESADVKICLMDNQGKIIKDLGFFMQQPAGAFNVPLEIKTEGIVPGNYKLTLIDQDDKPLEQYNINI